MLKILKYILPIFIIYFTVTSFYNVTSQINENNKRIASLSVQINEEKKVSKQLEDEKRQTNTDEYYKKVARETLGLVNPGDKVYINSNN